MAQHLYELIEQLTAGTPAGKKLRRQFHDHPESVAKQLTPKGRRALFSMDQNQGGLICAHVLTEFQGEGRLDEYDDWEAWFLAWPFPPNEFVPQGKLPAECRYETGPAYPSPAPHVYEISPRDVQVGTAQLIKEVVVIGQGFVTGRTRLELQEQGTTNQLPIALKYSGVEGSFRCGHLYADVTIPAGPLANDKLYDIRIILTTGTDAASNPVEWGPLPVRLEAGNTIRFKVKK